MWHRHTMEFYSVIGTNETLWFEGKMDGIGTHHVE
jgi:hypothetical protein